MSLFSLILHVFNLSGQHFSQDMQHVVATLLSGKAAASQVHLT